MSKDKPKKTTENREKKSTPGNSLKAFILAAGLVGVMAGAVGWFLGTQIAQEAASVSVQSGQKKASNEAVAAAHEGALTPLPAIVTNLREPEDAWVKMEISLVLQPPHDVKPEDLAEISSDFVALLRQMTLIQIKGPTGLMHLREDLLERARIRSNGKISALLISHLVIE